MPVRKSKALTKADLEQVLLQKDAKIEVLYEDIEKIDKSRDNWRAKCDQKDEKLIVLLQEARVNTVALKEANDTIALLMKERERGMALLNEKFEQIADLENKIAEMASRMNSAKVAMDKSISWPPTADDLRSLGLDIVDAEPVPEVASSQTVATHEYNAEFPDASGELQFTLTDSGPEGEREPAIVTELRKAGWKVLGYSNEPVEVQHMDERSDFQRGADQFVREFQQAIRQGLLPKSFLEF